MDGISNVPENAKTFVKKEGDNLVAARIKQPAPEGQKQDQKPEPFDVVALTTAMSAYSGNIKPGQTLTITVGKDPVAQISKTGPDNWDRAAEKLRDTGRAVVRYGADAIKEEPSFVFREAIESVKRPLSQMAPDAIQDLALVKGLYPGVRAGVLALDVRKAWKTIKNPESTMVDKIVDVGHCVTDVAGVVGSVAPLVGLAIPGANLLAAGAIIGDILSFAYHGIKYIVNKHTENKAKKAEEEAKKKAWEAKVLGQAVELKDPPKIEEPKQGNQSKKG